MFLCLSLALRSCTTEGKSSKILMIIIPIIGILIAVIDKSMCVIGAVVH